MFKELLLRKLIQSKMGDMPKEQLDKIVAVVSKNPKLFQEIAAQIKIEMDKGTDQMSAATKVMTEYKDQLQKLMGAN